MRKRVMGIENEWNSAVLLDGISGGFKFHGVEPCCFEFIRNTCDSENHFLSPCAIDFFLPNGSRIYMELGSFLETASPECRTPKEVLTFEKWAENLVAGSVRHCEGQGVFQRFNKKNCGLFPLRTREDFTPLTWGCHENYLAQESLFDSMEARNFHELLGNNHWVNFLILFLVTRQILAGSGGINPYHGRFEISPRTVLTNSVLNTRSTRPKSIICLKDDPLSGKNFFRFHLILGDANMADLSTFLKFGTTAAVLEMIEESFLDPRFRLARQDENSELEILHRISGSSSIGETTVELADGRSLNPIEIQRKFCNLFFKYLAATNQGGWKMEVAERWRETLDRLALNDELLYHQLDWKILKRIVEGYAQKHGLNLGDPRVRQVDFQYFNPDPQKSLYYLAVNRPGSKFEPLVSRDEIMRARLFPPKTRARLRTQIWKMMEKKGIDAQVRWHMIYTKDGYAIHLLDPFISRTEDLNPDDYQQLCSILENARRDPNNLRETGSGPDRPV